MKLQKVKQRESNLELLRILCILFIIGDHFIGQSGISENSNFIESIFYCAGTSLSRVACSVFVIISAWFNVDKDFDISKIFHSWFTVIMYTVPITMYLCIIGVANGENLYAAMFPIEESPLWFVGYYCVLMFVAPALNVFLSKASRGLIEYTIFILLCINCLYPTITARLGILNHDIFIMILLYLITGFIKKYCKMFSGRTNFIILGIMWISVTVIRGVCAYFTVNIGGGYTIAKFMSYLETYRARLQTIPNMIMAYAAFFAFYQLKVKKSIIINTMAKSVLGVYCMHQVPIWYMYLWTSILHTEYYKNLFHGKHRMLYTVICVIGVWLFGTLIELIRLKISNVLIEKRQFYRRICNEINHEVRKAVIEADSMQSSKAEEDITRIEFSKENKIEIGRNKRNMCCVAVIIMGIYFIVGRMMANCVNASVATLSSEQMLSDNQVNVNMLTDITFVDGIATGYVSVTNMGEAIHNLSSGTYPVNLGVSIVDEEGNVICQDLKHYPIKNYGDYKTGETKKVLVDLANLQQYSGLGYQLRFEIVQEGVSWMEEEKTFVKID